LPLTTFISATITLSCTVATLAVHLGPDSGRRAIMNRALAPRAFERRSNTLGSRQILNGLPKFQINN
jgi:hypothetical protein